MYQAPKLVSEPPPSHVLRLEPGVYQYTEWQGISIGVWVGQATLRAVNGLIEFGRDMHARHPNGHSSVVFILDKLPAPTPEARELFGRVLGARSHLACTAVILEGSGFWASGLRAMIGNTHRAAQGSVQLRIGTNIDEVLAWFPAEHERSTGIHVDPEALRDELRRAREENAAAALAAAR